jgi:hypothetical protein
MENWSPTWAAGWLGRGDIWERLSTKNFAVNVICGGKAWITG